MMLTRDTKIILFQNLITADWEKHNQQVWSSHSALARYNTLWPCNLDLLVTFTFLWPWPCNCVSSRYFLLHVWRCHIKCCGACWVWSWCNPELLTSAISYYDQCCYKYLNSTLLMIITTSCEVFKYFTQYCGQNQYLNTNYCTWYRIKILPKSI